MSKKPVSSFQSSDFTLQLLNKLSNNESGNIFVSPFSISSALGLVLLGSKENTALELKQALKLEGLSEDEYHQKYKSILQKFLENKDGVVLKIASKLYPDRSFSVANEYYENSIKFYNVTIDALDFVHQAEKSRNEINQWVEEQTNGKIKDLLPNGSINSDSKLVIANAIYFKGDWLEKFKDVDTSDMDFYTNDHESHKVKMMTKEHKFNVSTDQKLGVNAVELPYKNKDFSMILLVPIERFGLQKLQNLLNAKNLNSLLSGLFERKIILGLPRLKIEYRIDLVSTLKKLGINDVFVPNRANLSGISNAENLFVSGVFHKAFIEINEEGSEAAAATGITVVITSVGLPPQKIICDHPFMFIIRHNPTSTNLFAGQVTNP